METLGRIIADSGHRISGRMPETAWLEIRKEMKKNCAWCVRVLKGEGFGGCLRKLVIFCDAF
jgi:hypothetical protein